MSQDAMSYESRMQWFHEARFGLYIHYGLYSLLGRGEWTMYSERIRPQDYAPRRAPPARTIHGPHRVPAGSGQPGAHNPED